MFYLLFCRESELKLGSTPSYTNKLAGEGVIEIVNQNRSKTEPYSELVDDASVH